MLVVSLALMEIQEVQESDHLERQDLKEELVLLEGVDVMVILDFKEILVTKAALVSQGLMDVLELMGLQESEVLLGTLDLVVQMDFLDFQDLEILVSQVAMDHLDLLDLLDPQVVPVEQGSRVPRDSGVILDVWEQLVKEVQMDNPVCLEEWEFLEYQAALAQASQAHLVLRAPLAEMASLDREAPMALVGDQVEKELLDQQDALVHLGIAVELASMAVEAVRVLLVLLVPLVQLVDQVMVYLVYRETPAEMEYLVHEEKTDSLVVQALVVPRD